MPSRPSIARVLFDEAHGESWTIRPDVARVMQPSHPEDSSYARAAEALARHDLEVRVHADGALDGGGTLSLPGTTNTISTETGQALKITGMTILANTGVNFADVNRTAAGATTNAIQLETNTGGPITVGATTDLAGDAGTIEGGRSRRRGLVKASSFASVSANASIVS